MHGQNYRWLHIKKMLNMIPNADRQFLSLFKSSSANRTTKLIRSLPSREMVLLYGTS